MRVQVDGKFFTLDGRRFRVRGVTYGTFRPRDTDGARFPDRDQIKRDLRDIREAGFNTVRTYTVPPDDLVEIADEEELRLLVGVFYPDWRYLLGDSSRQRRRLFEEAARQVGDVARRFREVDTVLALSLGNEVPADVVRWYGRERIGGVIDRLAATVRDEDPERLVTYANYPTAEYLQVETLDFLTFNVFLERREPLRRYLTRLHHLAGDRPLVLGEVGLHAGDDADGERHQAEVLDWQLETAVERGVAGTCLFSWTDEWWVGDAAVEDWRFGLTREDRTERRALEVARRWNGRTVRDLDFPWPSISVVICAYNAEATLDECLTHACALDYPEIEVLVIDDGSTDDTAAIARRHERARLVSIEHGGLSVARNEGIRQATGEIVAYLDADAYPTPEWPYYLALAFDRPDVGGAGGPNVPPPDDGLGSKQVARAPGGPVHVLTADDRAEHVPGCNMAFWREQVLAEIGGFDPAYEAAGDDVDLCWRVLDAGWEIGFHPAALVWHHRRTGLRAYLRQQRGYGRAEALVEARHPERFTSLGSASWRGHIYDAATPSLGTTRIYHGEYGTAAYQSIYRTPGHANDLVHQVGMPVASVLLATSPLGFLEPRAALPALVAAVFIVVLGVVDALSTDLPREVRSPGVRFRLGVGMMHLLQPVVRTWGRIRARATARRDLTGEARLPGPVRRERGGVLVLPTSRDRAGVTDDVLTVLRRAGLPLRSGSGWVPYDARILGSILLDGHVVSSAYPEGVVQLRVRRKPRWGRALAWLLTGIVVVDVSGSLALTGAMLAMTAMDLAIGWVRTGPTVRHAIVRASER
ncbi:MAG: glycosyltransferase [Actinobacteria bacterium]|nr:glycosyltransferase [Actinomycetota bacterium]